MKAAVPGLEAWLPHRGAMVLLDAVVHVGAQRIVCTTLRHHAADNPLRIGGHLYTLAGIEFAAQAMALHVARHGSAHAAVSSGRLAAARDVNVRQRYLDERPGALAIECVRESVAQTASAYTFVLSARGQRVLDGRLVVIMAPMGAA